MQCGMLYLSGKQVCLMGFLIACLLEQMHFHFISWSCLLKLHVRSHLGCISQAKLRHEVFIYLFIYFPPDMQRD